MVYEIYDMRRLYTLEELLIEVDGSGQWREVGSQSTGIERIYKTGKKTARKQEHC
jgi:hypothetical protein